MEAVKPVPEGMHTVTPHLVCKGAAEAIAFYKNAFAAEELTRQEGPGGSILHATLRIGDSPVMLSDEFEDWGSVGPHALGGTPVVLHLYLEDVEAVFARAVEAGAEVTMPLEDTFWGDRYGKITDPFGHSWSLASHIRNVTPEEMEQAAQDMFANGA